MFRTLALRGVKFGFVGIANTLLGLGTIYVCKGFGFGDIRSNIIGYGCGLILSFYLNKSWTFGIAGKPQAALAVRFVCAFAIAYSINLGVLLFQLNVLSINSYLAQALSIPVYMIVFYVLCSVFVFTRQQAHVR